MGALFPPARQPKAGHGLLILEVSRSHTYTQHSFLAGINILCVKSFKRYRVLVGKPEGKRHLEDPGIDGRIILRLIFESEMGGMDWIILTQERDRWGLL